MEALAHNDSGDRINVDKLIFGNNDHIQSLFALKFGRRTLDKDLLCRSFRLEPHPLDFASQARQSVHFALFREDHHNFIKAILVFAGVIK